MSLQFRFESPLNHGIICPSMRSSGKQQTAGNRFMTVPTILLSITILFLVLLLLLTDGSGVKARKGIMNFRSLAFSIRGKIRLRGEWEFFWNHYYFPEDFDHDEELQDREFVEYTKSWEALPSRNGEERTYTAYGYATYRLMITGLAPRIRYAVMVPEINSSYTLWINGDRKLSTGLLGSEAGSSIPGGGPRYASFEADSGRVELVLQVANFSTSRGGPVQAILFGREGEVFFSDAMRIVLAYLHIVVCLLFAGIIWLDERRYRAVKREGESVYYGMIILLLCSLAFRWLLSDTLILYRLFPQISWSVFQRLRYLFTYLPGPLFLGTQIIRYRDKASFPKYIRYSIAIELIALPLIAAAVCLLPAAAYTAHAWLFDIHQLLIFLTVGIIQFKRTGTYTSVDTVLRVLLGFFSLLFIQMRLSLLGMLTTTDLSLFAFLDVIFMRQFNAESISIIFLVLSVIGYCIIFFLYTFSRADELMRDSLTKEVAKLEESADLYSSLTRRFGLTERELEIVRLVAKGLSNDEIAAVCYISTGTVKVHLNHIYSKTGSSSRTRLVRMILHGD